MTMTKRTKKNWLLKDVLSKPKFFFGVLRLDLKKKRRCFDGKIRVLVASKSWMILEGNDADKYRRRA